MRGWIWPTWARTSTSLPPTWSSRRARTWCSGAMPTGRLNGGVTLAYVYNGGVASLAWHRRRGPARAEPGGSRPRRLGRRSAREHRRVAGTSQHGTGHMADGGDVLARLGR
ncbi:MAG: hypothetical protein R3A10_04325 [Caldilineaceae bacterium]